MLGLKREIIKERDAARHVGKGGTKDIWVGDIIVFFSSCKAESALATIYMS